MFQIAVTQLHVAPSEFWAMEPRHFWQLVETLQPPETDGPNIPADMRREALDLLRAAERGEF